MIKPEPNCFQNWDPNNTTPHLLLPSPEELVPLSQTLISPDLALAFDIKIPDSPDARAVKRPRLVWTPQLHKRFVDAVAQLGIKNAVPKTIMQLMGVDGLTRENVASHLQKYRLYLKRMQGIGSGSGGDPAMDRLFSSSPVPALFLQGGENLSPFSAVGATQGMQFGQGRFGGVGGIGSGSNGVLDCSFLMGQSQPGQGVIGVQGYNSSSVYVDDVAGRDVMGGRRVLTLFPTGEDD